MVQGISVYFWLILNNFMDNNSFQNKCLSSVGFCGSDCEPSCPHLIDSNPPIVPIHQSNLVSILVCPRKLQILPILRCFGTVEDQGPQTVSVHAIRFQFQNFQLFSILVNGDNLDDSIVPKIQRHSVKLL